MKRVNNIYNKICDINVIMDMYDKVIKTNTKNKKKIQNFENFYSCNMAKIKETLITKSYVPGKYNIFLVKEPKTRIIMSQEIEDKIVNHLVAKYFLIDVFDKTLQDRNCATRKGKGTHYALRLFKKDYNYFKNKYKKFYVLKMDISKYFYNLDHEIIKQLVREKIKDKDVLKIIDSIIDSTNEKYINEKIIKLKENEKTRILNSNNKNKEELLQEIEKLPLYQNGKGVCIGNMVSQIVATVYLDKLDKYIENELGIKAHARYMDDFYCMHYDKNYLKEVLEKINEYLKKFKLALNAKTKIYSSTEGIEFLGFVFYNKGSKIYMKLTNKTKKKFKEKMKIKNLEYINDFISKKKYLEVRNSYRGHLSYGNCHSLYNKYVLLKL